MLYFLFNSVIEIRHLFFPSFLRGLALILLYIPIGVYTAQKLGLPEFLTTVPIQILLRSFIGPAFWGAIYSYGLYAGQQKHAAAIVQGMDANDPFLSSRLNPVIQGFMSQGKSVEVAQSLGIQSIWGAVQTQANLAASKEIFGYVIIAGFLVLLFVLLLRFAPINLRPLVKLKNRFRKKEMIKDELEMMAAVAP